MSLKIIHFSDIHTCSDKEKNIFLERIDAIVGACTSSILPDDDLLIVLSGDIAGSGKKEEYAIFENAFAKIVKKIKEECNREIDIVSVPGNHDCDFGTETEISNREAFVKNIVNQSNPSCSEIAYMLSVQSNYRAFESAFHCERINDLVNVKHFDYKCGKVAVYMVNTSWISQKHENVKERFFPITKLEDIDNLSSDLVITVFHHPAHWLHPDNCVEFQEKIKRFSDIIIMGHEHRNDSMEVCGADWKYVIREGTELQNPSNNSPISGFSIYDINNELNQITTYNYNWNGSRYSRQIQEGEIASFSRNARRASNTCIPNKETKKWLDDLELNIQHYRANNIILPSIFVWPDLDVIDSTVDITDIYGSRIKEDHFNHIMAKPLSLIVGESTSGKSTIAKIVYRNSIENEDNCIYIDATKITSYNADKLQKTIECKYIKQYDNQSLEEFQQLSKCHKVLIVDNFHNLKFKTDKKREVLKYFCAKFKNVILLSNLDVDCGLLIADCNKIDVHEVALYKIRPMGNRVRRNFIDKWFRLGANPEDEDEEIISSKVSKAVKYVDFVLGQYQGILPAFPIQLITILQFQDSTINNNQQISQYGYLYGSLIDASMSKMLSGEKINLCKGVLSELAFNILLDRESTDYTTDYCAIRNCVTKFSNEKIVPLDPDKLIELMVKTKILGQTGYERYKFMYPYIYYYFAGSYISSHLNDKNVKEHKKVKEQIDYMCQRLYNEAYGNIMIFVCYFSNNEEVIDSILLNSFELFNGVKPYNFANENSILQDAYDLVDKYINKVGIGSNEDVEKNIDAQLQAKDELAIQDGTVKDEIETMDTLDDLTEEERELTDMYAALKTISVLGQIIKCYPGTISGNRKVEIIGEIHDLGMRTANKMIDIFGMLEKDFVEFYIQREKDLYPTTSTQEISLYVKNTYRSILVQFVIAMIRGISYSFGGELSILAAEKALSSSTSGKLVLHDLKMHWNNTYIDDIIKDYNSWKNNGNEIAAIALKYLTINYLELNKCNHKIRDRLCAAFNLDKKKALLDLKSS